MRYICSEDIINIYSQRTYAYAIPSSSYTGHNARQDCELGTTYGASLGVQHL